MVWLPSRELCCCLSENLNWLCVLCVCVGQSKDKMKRKQMNTFCVKQLRKFKYVAHVLEEAVEQKYR